MHQAEPWFSSLRRTRVTCPTFADLPELTARIEQFRAAWNETPEPSTWTPASLEKVLARTQADLDQADAQRAEAA